MGYFQKMINAEVIKGILSDFEKKSIVYNEDQRF